VKTTHPSLKKTCTFQTLCLLSYIMAPFLIHPYQPPDKRLYYVIGRCDALQAPAIFLDWDDCSFYVDQNENDCQVEVQSFDRIMDAINYLTDQLTKRAKTKLSPRNIPAAATTAGNQPPHVSAVGNSNSNSNSRAARMPLPEHASLHYSSKRAAENNTSLASSLSAKRPRAEPPAVLVSTTPLNAIMFAKKIAMLQEYQQIHGTVQVKPRHCQEKFKGLSDFMSYWKKKKKHLEEDPSRDKKSALTEARIQQLQDLGVDLDSKWEVVAFQGASASGLEPFPTKPDAQVRKGS
jgi:hypothetical protein